MVDQPKCKDLKLCGCLRESTHREPTVRVHVYANDVTYKSSSPQPSLQVVAYRRITTMENLNYN